MVEVILPSRGVETTPPGHSGRNPRIEIHTIDRRVFGNSIALWVAGEIKIGSTEHVYAYDLKMKSIQVLVLTPEASSPGRRYSAKKYINHKGEYDNWASIDIWDDAGTAITAGNGPDDGSVWLDFIAVGE